MVSFRVSVCSSGIEVRPLEVREEGPLQLASVVERLGRESGFVLSVVDESALFGGWFAPSDLAARLERAGILWIPLPAKCGQIDSEAFESFWTYAWLRLWRRCKAGQPLVIHGWPDANLSVLALVRLATELDSPVGSLYRWLDGSLAQWVKPSDRRSARLVQAWEFLEPAERVVACLLGGAVGDAFGFPVESLRWEEIQQLYGPRGLQEPVWTQGKLLVSDDTQMTLFTLEGLLAAWESTGRWSEAVSHVREAYLDWLWTQCRDTPLRPDGPVGWLARQPELRERRGPGWTCLSALQSGGNGSIGRPINNSKGCGGVMRVAPVGLVGLPGGARAAFSLGAKTAALTHGHPSGYLSAGLMAAMVHALVERDATEEDTRRSLLAGIHQGCEILREYPGHGEVLRAVSRAVELSDVVFEDHTEAVARLGGGWTGEEALAIALYAALVGSSFVESVRIAANHSGDSDSTAALAGQLRGLIQGLQGIPHSWILALDVFVPAVSLCRRLVRLRWGSA